MGIHKYKTWNGPMPTTAAQLKVTTGTAIKTMLQIAAPSTRMLTVLSWGYSMDAGQLGRIELVETDVAATVTAAVASGVQPLVSGIPASLVTLGASATGYTASAEGAITTTREFDVQEFTASGASPNVVYNYQFMPDERPLIGASKFLRVRATMGTAVNMVCWVCWEE